MFLWWEISLLRRAIRLLRGRVRLRRWWICLLWWVQLLLRGRRHRTPRLHVVLLCAVQLVEGGGARRDGDFGPGCIATRGAGRAGELLELPHVLPLLFGGHFLVVRG